MNHIVKRLALTGLLCGSAAFGQDVHFGLQGHLAKPTGKAGDSDHLDGQTGFGLGAQLPVFFQGGHVFRPKLDYVTFSRDTNGITSKASTTALIADYNYYFSGKREGGYLIAGLGFHSTKREISGSYYGYGFSVDSTDSGLAYNFGFGVAFNQNVGLELKYMGAELPDFKYQGYLVDSSYAANAFMVSLSVTF